MSGNDDDDDRLILEKDEIAFYKAPLWLNDNCIEFWLEHVYYDKLNKNPDLVFVSPCTMSIVCHMTPDMVAENVKLLKLPSRQLVFMPINDNNMGFEGGGSHWSLLLYCRGDNTFRYFDSMSGSQNIETAKASAQLMRLALGTEPAPKFVDEASSMPQQTNGHDCGLYVLLTAQLFASHFTETKALPSASELCSAVSPASAAQLRSEAHALALRTLVLHRGQPEDT